MKFKKTQNVMNKIACCTMYTVYYHDAYNIIMFE